MDHAHAGAKASTYSKLVDNLRINDLCSRVRAVNAGASDVRGMLRFTSSSDTTNHVVRQGSGLEPEVDVPVYTLDELLEGARATILKIDVEGYELQVIQGACNTLSQASALIIELNGSGNRYGHSDEQVVGALRDLGFSRCRYRPEERRLESEQGSAKSPNAIFVRDAEWAAKALARPVRYQVHGVEV